MTMNDLISNYLTRVRNAYLAGHENVSDIPSSKVLEEISRVLQEAGYIQAFRVIEVNDRKTLSVDLKYHNNKSVITRLERVSKLGRRVYSGADDIPYVKEGLGVAIVTTNRGVMTDAQARKLRVGGEIICQVW
ncbi:30S ribosomal protein S8 [bacterium]|nr:30S ribosomal protein S8 [bacterium]